MSMAQETRAHQLVKDFTRELEDLKSEIVSLKEQIASKEKEAMSLQSQITQIMMSDSY